LNFMLFEYSTSFKKNYVEKSCFQQVICIVLRLKRGWGCEKSWKIAYRNLWAIPNSISVFLTSFYLTFEK
jgi:hypothetical protein